VPESQKRLAGNFHQSHLQWVTIILIAWDTTPLFTHQKGHNSVSKPIEGIGEAAQAAIQTLKNRKA
jgi:hypothetical protein